MRLYGDDLDQIGGTPTVVVVTGVDGEAGGAGRGGKEFLCLPDRGWLDFGTGD